MCTHWGPQSPGILTCKARTGYSYSFDAVRLRAESLKSVVYLSLIFTIPHNKNTAGRVKILKLVCGLICA